MENQVKRVAVLGGGSWATAIAKMLLNNPNNKTINWYMRRQEQIEDFKKHGHNPSYLTSTHFEVDRINFYSNINEVVEVSDILILAIPSPFLKMHLKNLKTDISNKYLVSAIKGIVPDECFGIFTSILQCSDESNCCNIRSLSRRRGSF